MSKGRGKGNRNRNRNADSPTTIRCQKVEGGRRCCVHRQKKVLGNLVKVEDKPLTVKKTGLPRCFVQWDADKKKKAKTKTKVIVVDSLDSSKNSEPYVEMKYVER